MPFVDCLDGVGYLMLALLVWGGGLSCGLILPLVDQEGVSLAVCWRAPYTYAIATTHTHTEHTHSGVTPTLLLCNVLAHRMQVWCPSDGWRSRVSVGTVRRARRVC